MSGIGSDHDPQYEGAGSRTGRRMVIRQFARLRRTNPRMQPSRPCESCAFSDPRG